MRQANIVCLPSYREGVPKALIELLRDKDPTRSQRVMKAMFQMKKIDIAELERAAMS